MGLEDKTIGISPATLGLGSLQSHRLLPSPGFIRLNWIDCSRLPDGYASHSFVNAQHLNPVKEDGIHGNKGDGDWRLSVRHIAAETIHEPITIFAHKIS